MVTFENITSLFDFVKCAYSVTFRETRLPWLTVCNIRKEGEYLFISYYITENKRQIGYEMPIEITVFDKNGNEQGIIRHYGECIDPAYSYELNSEENSSLILTAKYKINLTHIIKQPFDTPTIK